MKQKLIFGVLFLAMGYATSQVMSQPPSTKRLAKASEPRNAAGSRESFNDEIRRLREKLEDLTLQNEPAARDVALLKAFDKYLASDKLSRIITELEEFAKQSPGTDEATRAAAAIQLLKADAQTALQPIPDPNSFQVAPARPTIQPTNGDVNFERDQ